MTKMTDDITIISSNTTPKQRTTKNVSGNVSKLQNENTYPTDTKMDLSWLASVCWIIRKDGWMR